MPSTRAVTSTSNSLDTSTTSKSTCSLSICSLSTSPSSLYTTLPPHLLSLHTPTTPSPFTTAYLSQITTDLSRPAVTHILTILNTRKTANKVTEIIDNLKSIIHPPNVSSSAKKPIPILSAPALLSLYLSLHHTPPTPDTLKPHLDTTDPLHGEVLALLLKELKTHHPKTPLPTLIPLLQSHYTTPPLPPTKTGRLKKGTEFLRSHITEYDAVGLYQRIVTGQAVGTLPREGLSLLLGLVYGPLTGLRNVLVDAAGRVKVYGREWEEVGGALGVVGGGGMGGFEEWVKCREWVWSGDREVAALEREETVKKRVGEPDQFGREGGVGVLVELEKVFAKTEWTDGRMQTLVDMLGGNAEFLGKGVWVTLCDGKLDDTLLAVCLASVVLPKNVAALYEIMGGMEKKGKEGGAPPVIVQEVKVAAMAYLREVGKLIIEGVSKQLEKEVDVWSDLGEAGEGLDYRGDGKSSVVGWNEYLDTLEEGGGEEGDAKR